MDRVTGLPRTVGAAMDRGALVVTSNERAARSFRRAYDRERVQAGEERWAPAEVLSWAGWTGALWRGMLLDGKASSLLLNAVQENAVWRGVLESDEGLKTLSGLDGLARMAANAWARMCAWGDRGAATRLEGWGGSADAAAFAGWAKEFRRRCEAEGLLSGAELDGALTEALRAGDLGLERREVVLVGFDELTPARDRMARAMQEAGVRVERLPVRVEDGRGVLAAAKDAEEELRGCARWVKARLEAGGSRIAVVVPGLEVGERARMERVLREVVAPEMEDVRRGEGAEGAAFEFSLGRALGEAPGVRAAMDLLRWVAGPLELERISGLLLSPYFAGGDGGEETRARAEFDAFELRRRERLRPELTLAEMIREAGASQRAGRLGGVLAALRGLGRRAGEVEAATAGFGEWAQRMREVLTAGRWGSRGTETSVEFQARERWETALDTLATLDFRGGRVSYGEALRALERIVGETVFAPESKDAPVQVMGVTEAAGSEFDAVWVMGAGEMGWPVEERSSPLLPRAMQRKMGMPGADVERDAERGRRVTERLAGSGGEVVWSYSRTTAQGGRQRASAMVRALGLEEVDVEALAPEEQPRARVELERMEDAGEIAALPEGLVGGGVSVLQAQAACGFRAFAEQRLWSSEVETRELGMNAMERGSAVHAALRSFWDEVQTHAALVAMSESERKEVLGRAIESALDGAVKRSRREGGSDWDRAYVEAQRRRLERLLDGWLKMEAARTPFEVIATEKAVEDAQVGPLRLRFRLDRVDRVDGMDVLIDYKTGIADPKQWMGERPDQPQLPMYAVVAEARRMEEARRRAEETVNEAGDLVLAAESDEPEEGRLGGVAFGSVRLGKDLRLRGVGEREVGGIKLGKLDEGVLTFEEQVERWDGVLTELAEQFARGDARVRPKNYPGTCVYCGQRMLCRLDASLLEEMEDEGENGAEENG